jgi:hypothetical protein
MKASWANVGHRSVAIGATALHSSFVDFRQIASPLLDLPRPNHMSDDTALVLACEDFNAAYNQLVEAAHRDDEEGYEADLSVDRLVNEIASRVPTTTGGIRAKARAAVLLWPEADFSPEDQADDTALARSLLADLARMRDPSPVVRFDPADLRFPSVAGSGGSHLER